MEKINQKGTILISLTVIIVIMVMLAGVMLYCSTTSSYGELFANRQARAYYLGESGGKYALQKFDQNTNYTNGPFYCPDPCTNPPTFTLNNGKFAVRTYDKPGDSTHLIIEATGIVESGWLTTRQVITYNINKSNPTGGSGTEFVNFLKQNNVFVYGAELYFQGGNVKGENATVVIKGDMKTSDLNGGASVAVTTIYIDGNVKLDGGSASLGSSNVPGNIYINGSLELWNGSRHIYGNVYVNGNFRLKDAIIHGNIYVNGNVELGWTPTLDTNSHIYYTGTLSCPNNKCSNYNQSILAKCIKQATVPDFTMPGYPIPPPKSGAWFTAHGYVSSGTLVNNLKIYTEGDYISSSWRPDVSNVIIVSKGDISITGMGGSKLTGVLYAPSGKVTFNGGSFEGFVISQEGFFVTSGGTTITFKGIENYITDSNDYPFSLEPGIVQY